MLRVLALVLPALSASVDGGVVDARAGCPDLGAAIAGAYAGTEDSAAARLFECLPRVPGSSDLVIVEGDLVLDQKELADYVRAAKRPATPSPRNRLEKLVDVRTFLKLKADEKLGVLTYWKTLADRKLSFAIDGRSFRNDNARYFAVQKAITSATSEWSELCPKCGVQFTYRWERDWSSPAPDGQLTFVVKGADSGGEYTVLSFFPDTEPRRRFIYVDTTFFAAGQPQIGLFRHELGHVLGYRHEHIEGVPGCIPEQGGWRSLTPYDPHSVMHYFCGDGGTKTFEFSEDDRKGHSQLYLGAAMVKRLEAAPRGVQLHQFRQLMGRI